MRILSGVFALFVFTSASAQLDNAQIDAIDRIANGVRQAAALPSIVVHIDQGGQTVYSQGFGTANLEHNLAPSAQIPYAIGSITKSFTALAVLKLVAAGQISLEAAVSTYLPDYAGPAGQVAVRHLLDHTAGIPNYTSFPEHRDPLSRNNYTRAEMVAMFENRPLEFQPGDKFSYSNSGYYLLGLIIEAVSGQDYYQYLSENIFSPLGMTHTYSGHDAEIIPLRSGGYEYDGERFVNHSFWSYLAPFAAGSLISTAEDITRYRRAVFNSNVFSGNVKRLVMTRHKLNDGTENVYALGALIESDFHGHTKYAHSGDIWGYASNHAYYPAHDLTIVVFANRQIQAPSLPSIEQKIARVVLGIPQPEVLDLALSEQELQAYAGEYALHPFLFGVATYGIGVKDGKLMLHLGGTGSGGPPIPLLAQGDQRFRVAFDDEWILEFLPLGSDMHLLSTYRDGVFYAQRVAKEMESP